MYAYFTCSQVQGYHGHLVPSVPSPLSQDFKKALRQVCLLCLCFSQKCVNPVVFWLSSGPLGWTQRSLTSRLRISEGKYLLPVDQAHLSPPHFSLMVPCLQLPVLGSYPPGPKHLWFHNLVLYKPLYIMVGSKPSPASPVTFDSSNIQWSFGPWYQLQTPILLCLDPHTCLTRVSRRPGP